MDAITQVVALDTKGVELTTKYGLNRGKVFYVVIEVRKYEKLLGAMFLDADGIEWSGNPGKRWLEWTKLLRQYRAAERKGSGK